MTVMLLPLFRSSRMNLLRFVLPLCFVTVAFAAQPSATQSGEFTYKRGVNISHWLSQNIEARPYADKWFVEEDVR